MDLKKVCLFLTLYFSSMGRAEGLERVLFIGDSHSYGAFGIELDNYLRSKSQKVRSVASCGASPSTYMAAKANFKKTNCGYWQKDDGQSEIRSKTQKLKSFDEHYAQIEPDLVVIALGTNALSSPKNVQIEIASIEKMISKVKGEGRQCIWIGPPDLLKNPFRANLISGNSIFKAAIEKRGCRYIDSTELTQYADVPRADGIHYNAKASAEWGKSVVKKINSIWNDIMMNSVVDTNSKIDIKSGSSGR